MKKLIYITLALIIIGVSSCKKDSIQTYKATFKFSAAGNSSLISVTNHQNGQVQQLYNQLGVVEWPYTVKIGETYTVEMTGMTSANDLNYFASVICNGKVIASAKPTGDYHVQQQDLKFDVTFTDGDFQ